MPSALKQPTKWAAKVHWYKQHGRHGKPYSIVTIASMKHIRKRWQLFCHDAELGDPKEALGQVLAAGLKAFFDWMIENAERAAPQADSLLQYFRILKMVYHEDTGSMLDSEVVEDVKDFIKYHAKGKSETVHRPKPVPTGADLVRILHYLYAEDPAIYPSERERVQQGFLILIHAFTGLRPSSTTQSSKGRKRCDIGSGGGGGEAEDVRGTDRELEEVEAEIIKLRYRDIKLFVSADDLGRTRFIAQATFSYFKGGDRRPQRKTFTWPDQSDMLLCLVSHLIALAIHDEAFDPPRLNNAEAVLSLQVFQRDGRVKIPWKAAILDLPILRAAGTGHQPQQLTDNVSLKRLKELGTRMGSPETVTWYWLRRLVLNAVDGHGSEEVRNQVAGHLDSRTYRNHYQDQHIGLDIASLVRGQESENALIRRLNEPGLDADPRCNKELPSEAREQIAGLPDMVSLKEKWSGLSQILRDNYGTISKAPASHKLKQDYERAKGEYRAKMQSHLARLKTQQRRAYFTEKDAAIIAAQLDGSPLCDVLIAEPKRPNLTIPERITLVRLVDSKDLRAPSLHAERVIALKAMADLCSRVERRGVVTADITHSEDNKSDSGTPENNDVYPMRCHRFQCLFCLGDSLLLFKHRTRILKNQYELGRHVKTHLRKIDKFAKIACPHPRCMATSTTLNNLQHLKNHVQREHGIRLQTH